MRKDLLDTRLTEQRNPDTIDIDRADTLEIVDRIHAEDRKVPEAVASQRVEIARAIDIAVECFRRGGRLFYVGAGTSGRLGVLDAAECPPTFGTDPEMVQGIIAGGHPALVRSQEGAEDRSEDAAAALDERELGADDFVIGIAASSTTPFVRGALQRALEVGARTGFVCCTEPDPDLRARVEVCIVPLVGPEVIAGSTRMKAGTATKLVLNTISTGAMIRMGKVYQNLMVDLRAASDKLVDRGERIVMALTGSPREGARAAIAEADGSVKRALVMTLAGVGPGLADLLLAEGDGFVAAALDRARAASRALEESGDPYSAYPSDPPSPAAVESLALALRGMSGRVAALVKGVPADRLRARLAPDRWCVNEQIEHLIVVSEMMRGRVEAVLEQDDPALPEFDESVENPKILESGAREEAVTMLIRRLADARASLMARLEDASVHALGRAGRHERFGRVTAYQLLRHLARHDDHHVRSIRDLIGR